MDGLLQSANDALNSLIFGAGGYFDWITSALRQQPLISTMVAALLLGAWLFHRRDPSAP
jgi:uncharacterized protein (TIGR03382 family)